MCVNFQIRKDISTVEQKFIQQNATSGCVSRKGQLCIGLCITVILYYIFLNFHHLLSSALISILNLLISVLYVIRTLLKRSLYLKTCFTKESIQNECTCVLGEKNNSDNNFNLLKIGNISFIDIILKKIVFTLTWCSLSFSILLSIFHCLKDKFNGQRKVLEHFLCDKTFLVYCKFKSMCTSSANYKRFISKL